MKKLRKNLSFLIKKISKNYEKIYYKYFSDYLNIF